jgi:hypothetical protein
MSETANLPTDRRDDIDGSRKIVRAASAANPVASGSGADAVRLGGQDSVAVWVNEGGAGGEVLR